MKRFQFDDNHAVDSVPGGTAAAAALLGGTHLDDEQVRGAYMAAWSWLSAEAGPGARDDADEESVECAIDGPGDDHDTREVLAVSLAATLAARRTGASGDVYWIGCRSNMTRGMERSVIYALQHGATVIASDRSASCGLFRNFLLAGQPSGPHRARVEMTVEGPCVARLPVLPAVRLPAGHLRLAADAQRIGRSRVLARDVLSGAPVAVLVPVLSGYVIYSSAHWMQREPVDLSGLGQRPLFAVSAYANVGEAYPFVSVGEFHAAVAMLSILATGLALAWSTAAVTTFDAVTARHEDGREAGKDGLDGAVA